MPHYDVCCSRLLYWLLFTAGPVALSVSIYCQSTNPVSWLLGYCRCIVATWEWDVFSGRWLELFCGHSYSVVTRAVC